MIPWASPLAQYQAHAPAIRGAIDRVLQGGNYILGEEVATLERAFRDHCGIDHAVGVGSGTDALILALRALGVGAGDEVITVSHTAVATVSAVLATGAKPVLVDVDSSYYTLDPSAIHHAATPRTRAVIVVHLYGQVADMDAIESVARRHNLKVVEDCAQAAGARHRGRRVGTMGDVGCFSFYPTKNLGGIGDGGMVVTNDADLAARVRRLAQYGWDDKRQTRGIGVNSRLDPLQAAILSVKLPHLDVDNARRASIARRYDAGLAGLPLTVPAVRTDTDHVYHLYVIATEERDAFREQLAHAGIGSAIHYFPAVHDQDGYTQRVTVAPGGLPVTSRLATQIVSLPIYPELSDRDTDQVIAAVRDCFRQPRRDVASA